MILSNKTPSVAATTVTQAINQQKIPFVEASNSISSGSGVDNGGGGGKRRQLPQIPLDKQQMHRNKSKIISTFFVFVFHLLLFFSFCQVAHELEEKALKIKSEIERKNSIKKQPQQQQQSQHRSSYSISDSEANIDKYTLNKSNTKLNQAKIRAQTSYEEEEEEEDLYLDEEYNKIALSSINAESSVTPTTMTTSKVKQLPLMPPASQLRISPGTKLSNTRQSLKRHKTQVDNQDNQLTYQQQRNSDDKVDNSSLINNNSVKLDNEEIIGTDSAIESYRKSRLNEYIDRKNSIKQTIEPQLKQISPFEEENLFKPITPARKLSPTPAPLQVRSRSQGGDSHINHHHYHHAPEKLSIMKDLKQRTLAISNTSINRIDTNKLYKQHTTGQIDSKTGVNRTTHNTFDFDSDGSEFSTVSNANSILSTQSERLKGAKARFANEKSNTITGTTAVSTISVSAGSSYQTNNIIKPSILKTTPTSTTTSTGVTTTTSTTAKTGTTNNPILKKQSASIDSDKKDGTLSDSALTNPLNPAIDNKKRRPSVAKALVILGLSKKSSSACNLSYSK